jgi:hypothetical protein
MSDLPAAAVAQLDDHEWRDAYRMANLEPGDTGLPSLIHLYQGQTRHAPRIKVQLTSGRINLRNSVAVALHDAGIVRGRNDLVRKFEGSWVHGLVKRFIELNHDALLAHSRAEITDTELRRRLKKVAP